MGLRVGYGFRLGGGAGVIFGGSGAVWVFLAIGSMRLMLALLFLALVSMVTLMKVAAETGAQSAGGRRRIAAPYLVDAVDWDVEKRLTANPDAVRLWGVYAVGGSFFAGRHPDRIAQLRAAYPDRASRVVAVAVFPSADLARTCARGLKKHGFSSEELFALFGRAPRMEASDQPQTALA